LCLTGTTGSSVKDHKHRRQSTKCAPSVQVDETRPVCSNQQLFLANSSNKSQFIALLGRRLSEEGHTVRYAPDDADTLIVKSAVEVAEQQQSVTVVAEDTDILVLLVHHVQPGMAEVYMLSVCKARKSMVSVSIQKVQEINGTSAVRQLLVIHALAGCDTTSALHGRGKASAFWKLVRSADTMPLTDIVASTTGTADEVASAGMKLLVLLYGGQMSDNLNRLRFAKYMQKIPTSQVLPEKLPPTERAALYHSLRVHLQVMQWTTLNTSVTEATNWGWKLEGKTLVPIPTDLEPAPADLFKVIRCNCKRTSVNQCVTSICTCRKNGLHCISACGGCHGELCGNVQPNVDCADSEADAEVVYAAENNMVHYVDDDDITWQWEEVCE